MDAEAVGVQARVFAQMIAERVGVPDRPATVQDVERVATELDVEPVALIPPSVGGVSLEDGLSARHDLARRQVEGGREPVEAIHVDGALVAEVAAHGEPLDA